MVDQLMPQLLVKDNGQFFQFPKFKHKSADTDRFCFPFLTLKLKLGVAILKGFVPIHIAGIPCLVICLVNCQGGVLFHAASDQAGNYIHLAEYLLTFAVDCRVIRESGLHQTASLQNWLPLRKQLADCRQE